MQCYTSEGLLRVQAKIEVMKVRLSFQPVGWFSMALVSATAGAAGDVSFSQPAETVEAYDFVEVTARVDQTDAPNPFLETTLTGSFSKIDGGDRKTVEGFCDS